MLKTVTLALTTDTNLHAIGDVVGGRLDLSALASKKQEGYIAQIGVRNWLNTALDIRIYIYDGRHAASPGADNAALAFTEADLAEARFFHVVEFASSDFAQSGTGLQSAQSPDTLWLPIPPTIDPVYAVVETLAALTPAASGKIQLNFNAQLLTPH